MEDRDTVDQTNTMLRPTPGFDYYRGDIYWNSFDQVQTMLRTLVSGDPSVSWVGHLRAQHGTRDKALFINCGNGWVERDCYQSGLIRSAIGFDVSRELVDIASTEAEKIGMPSCYFQADANQIDADISACDLIVNHGAMHHVAFIDRLTRRLAASLNTGGIYVVNDYTGPHRNQYSWEAHSRAIEVNQWLPEEYRVHLGYAHIPTMLSLDPTEAVHSELQMTALSRYFDIVSEVRFGGALAYPLLFQSSNLLRDQHTERGAALIRAILDADRAFLRDMPESNLFTFAVCKPKADTPGRAQLDHWHREEDDREARARLNGGRYYPPTALELIYSEIIDLQTKVALGHSHEPSV